MNSIKVVDKPASHDVYNERPNGLHSLIGGAIVLHHTAGTNSLDYLRGGHGVSTHKLFAKNGTIYKIVADIHRAWHAGVSAWDGRNDWNNFSLGYEIENLGDGHDPYTDLQYEAVAQSVAYDTALYHISDHWVRHHKEIAIPAGRKNDAHGWDNQRMWRRVDEIRAAWPLAEWGIPVWSLLGGTRTTA